MHLLPVSPSHQRQPQCLDSAGNPLHLTNIRSTHHHGSSRVSQPGLHLVHQRMQHPRRHPHH